MELRHLRYFVAVAAHGSFNRAAEILHLTQPTLSRQVKDLEDELDVPLLVRGQNAVKLTEAGELFYEEARQVLARADEAIQRVGCASSGWRRATIPNMCRTCAGCLSRSKYCRVSPHS